MRLLCWLGFHAWTTTKVVGGHHIPSSTTVFRRCARCSAKTTQIWWQGRRL